MAQVESRRCMDARRLRRLFIEFFLSKEHQEYPPAPLVPVDVTGKLDDTLLFTGAGMVQFKPFFRGLAEPPCRRLVNSQRCVRAVDIEEVGNLSHLTFFEMLGNFSFGDYFKKEAIEYAWEFLFGQQWLKLDPEKVAVTVFEEDDEAWQIWAELWKDAGFEPDQKIHRLGEDKNYWPANAFSQGPPGPCGPCSEIFYQTVDARELVGDFKTDEAEGRWLEIWNLVFMQYEWRGHLKDPEAPHLGYVKEGMEPLPTKNIDTGSGLERTAAVIGGFASVYDTDVFKPIVERVAELAGHRYGTDGEKDRAVRIISDHMRTASMCIMDGILPSNTGRGYVLRRLMRRAILKGDRVLGLSDEFLTKVFPAVIEALGDPYVELSERRSVIEATLESEEELFRRTLRQGMERFNEMAPEKGVFSGKDAFFLYDTLGFPLEVTQELAAERGLEVDVEGFRACMKEAQERSRAAQGGESVFRDAEEILLVASPNAQPVTPFVGYDQLEIQTEIVQISPRFDDSGKTDGRFQVCLAMTPFYPEGGGQVGDTGRIEGSNFSLKVEDTWREGALIWHDCRVESFAGKDLVGLTEEEIREVLESGAFFQPVRAIVDRRRRLDTTRNHTATHLLHAALRRTLGTHVTQAGSLVAPDRLRFDFTHADPLTDEQLDDIERQINEQIAEAHPVVIESEVPLSEARQRGAMMLFGEKYGDRVRVVGIPGLSLELCGGCHVRNTAEIGLFKITSEGSSASGVRRIEAVTGWGAYVWAREREGILQTAAKALKAPIADIPAAVERLQQQVKQLKKAAEQAAAATTQEVTPIELNGVTFWPALLSDVEPSAARKVVDELAAKAPESVACVVLKQPDKVTILCRATDASVAKGANAGLIVRAAAEAVGGKGGGQPEFAQGGGRNPEKAEEALKAAEAALRDQIGARA
ncbi:MAG: alanine--tRNA ligase [Armatimonadetes bacterium]|nr:MAG: alanine--tRNA ligase [Armatimonadota bacterium]